MTKKEYIIKILDALLETWPLAKGLKILVEGNNLDDKTIDSLVDIFANTINEIQNEEAKQKLQKSQKALQNLKQIEHNDHVYDQKSLDDLDEMIKNI